MFRFTIRELLILTLTVGLAVGWWIDRRSLLASAETTRQKFDEELTRLNSRRPWYQPHGAWSWPDSGSKPLERGPFAD